MNNSNRNKVLGVLFSYIGSAFQIVISLFLPAFLIATIGETSYGIYQMMSSFGGNILLFNFGIATIMSRSVTKCRAEKTDIKKALHTGIAAAAIIMTVTLVVSFVMLPLIPHVYSESLSKEQLIIGYQIYYWLIASSSLYIWQRALYGVMIGCEKFAFTNALQFIVQIVRACLISVLVFYTKNVLMIVVAEVIIGVLHIVIELLYCKNKLKIRLSLKEFLIDREMLNVAVLFGLASFLQSITRQVNNSMDKIILGAVMIPKEVTIYSTGLSLMTAYITITKLVSGVYLPDATKLVVQNAQPMEYEKMMKNPMRFQAFISMAILFGFISVGREFYTVWLGEQYTVMWLPIIIIFVPLSIANLASIPDVVLDAKLKKLSRSIALFIMAIINLIISLMLVKKLGFYGVAIGTSASFLLGNVIIMGIVYIKNIGVNIFKLYYSVSWKMIVAGGISCIITLITIKLLLLVPIIELFLGGSLFLLLYMALIIVLLSKKEREQYLALSNSIKQRFINKVRE